MPKISQKEIKKKLEQLLSSEEGIVTVLAASLVLSDFDEPSTAITEAVKTYNSNQIYFNRIVEIWKKQ